MVKGVARQVIEIAKTENAYFERAILFLRQDAPKDKEESPEQRGAEYLRQLKYRRCVDGRSIFWEAMRWMGAMVLGGLLTFGAMMLGWIG